MNCPKCQAPLEKVTYQTVELEQCSYCQGLWFDAQEVEILKTVAGAEAIDTGDPKVGDEYNQTDEVLCPHCQTQMTKMVDAEQSHIHFEKCPVCYGVWLDAGEFKDLKQTDISDLFKRLFSRERK